MIKYAQGTIWWANLPEAPETPTTYMTMKTRPVLIVSNDEFNANHHTVTVLPMTRQDVEEMKIRPGIITSLPYEEKKFSYIMVDQMRIIDKKDLDNYYGTLTDEELLRVKFALSEYLGLSMNHKETKQSAVCDFKTQQIA